MKNKHIIILGSARSGTSWLCENMARQPRYRLLFEPEHPNHVPEGKYIADHTVDTIKTKDSKTFFNRLFANRIDNDWIAQHSYRKYKRHLWPFIPKFFVIKMIRTNLLASFFVENYNHPIVFVVRNPYHVIHSQNRVKFPWLYDLSVFQNNENLCNYLFDTTKIDLVKGNFTNFEKLIIRWGIENALYPIPKHSRLYFYKYEELRNDYSLIKQLMLDTKMSIPENFQKQLQEPSSKTHKRSDIMVGSPQKTLSTSESMLVKTILSKFPIQHYEL